MPTRKTPAVVLLCALLWSTCRPGPRAELSPTIGRLPTGATLDPAGQSATVGSLPLAMLLAPEGDRVVLLLNGWREQGIQVVDRATGIIQQTVEQPAAFLGIAFGEGGRTLLVSGGNQDVVYRYDWHAGRARLRDSLVLAPKHPNSAGKRYPAGLAPSPDQRMLYVAENLADSLAVVELASGRVVQRLATERYPYGVAIAPNGTVYVSAWGGHTVSAFEPRPDGTLMDAGRLRVARHPSALLLSADGSRLYVASGSTDRVAVVDTRTRQVIGELLDPPPSGPAEGSTPNALALSADGRRLFVAEADNNAVAVFDVDSIGLGLGLGLGKGAGPRQVSAAVAEPQVGKLLGRIPVGWYPSALLVSGDTLLVANGKGAGTAPNPGLPQPPAGTPRASREYTLGQLSGTLTTIVAAGATAKDLEHWSGRVARANRWDRKPDRRAAYPPFEHVIYIIKENRTFDQVLGDLPQADGDSTLTLFPRPISPNHHALAERFGIFDRFFVNAEVSADGHNWSTAAYATDYVQKTVPSAYSSRGRHYDYEGSNRGLGRIPSEEGEDDVAEPALGYLWDLAQRAGITFRNYGEFVVEGEAKEADDLPRAYRGTKPFLAAHTHPTFPGYDLTIPDQKRADVWLAEFAEFVQAGRVPALSIVRLPNDHTSAGRAGRPTPRAYVADNDLALGRVIEALSRSPFWKSTVVFVLEDDAQNGPDHVDSHRSILLVISPYNRAGVSHRWTNTTDVIATMSEILGLGRLSQFDYFGRPLREIFRAEPDLTPYTALAPAVSLDERNPSDGPGAEASAELDLRLEDLGDDVAFSRALWLTVKGKDAPYPGVRRMPALEWKRGR